MQADRSGRPAAGGSSVSPDEIARFGRLAADWWDPNGPMRPLHRMNPLRTAWAHARFEPLRADRLGGAVRLLDLGCGAGLASESFAGLGYEVLGVDAAAEAIAAAEVHAAQASHRGRLTYRTGSAEVLLAEGRRFDAITALEVIEHVTDPRAFLALLAGLLEPDGVIVVSTLNRTWRSLATAKIAAEYLLRLLPAGTHAWRQFVTPAELGAHAKAAGLRVTDIAGMVPSRLGSLDHWRESQDLGVNYIAAMSLA